MHWEFLIPVIAIIVFIVSSLLRGEDDAPRPGTRPGARTGKPAKDIDRFLEEMNRRRRQAAGQGEVATGERLPVPRPRPVPAPPPARRPPERPRQPPPPPPAVRVLPPPPPPLATPVVAQPGPVVAPIQSVALIQAIQAPAAVRRVDEPRLVPPAMAQVVALLKSPQSLQAAFLLREILGEPLCRRNQGRQSGHS